MSQLVRARFCMRNMLAEEWLVTNPTLMLGEAGLEKDTNKIKIGDGITSWANLNYISANEDKRMSNTVIPSYWQKPVENVISKINNLQKGAKCITFPFFSDNNQRLGFSGALCYKVMEACHLPFCFYGGNSLSSEKLPSKEAMSRQNKLFDNTIKMIPPDRFCYTIGKSDGLWSDNQRSYKSTRDDIYELFLREGGVGQKKHFGLDGCYYYVDDLASRTRFVVLNSEACSSINDGDIDNLQLAWLQSNAFKFEEPGWGIVVFSHRPVLNYVDASLSADRAKIIRDVFKNYKNGNSQNKAELIGWWSGSTYQDKIYIQAPLEPNAYVSLPCAQITITSDNTEISSNQSTWHQTGSDEFSHAIDFVTINRNTGDVNMTRLGIGEDRSFNYKSIENF